MHLLACKMGRPWAGHIKKNRTLCVIEMYMYMYMYVLVIPVLTSCAVSPRKPVAGVKTATAAPKIAKSGTQ